MKPLGTALAVAVALLLSACSGGSETVNLSAPVAQPAQITSRLYAPSGLGVVLMVPSTWGDAPPSSGFQFTLHEKGGDHFLLASSTPGGNLTMGQYSSIRRRYLQGNGATITSRRDALVDNHGAVELHYTLSAEGRTVADVEYDIATGSRAAIVVLGESAPTKSDALFKWIASTIKVVS